MIELRYAEVGLILNLHQTQQPKKLERKTLKIVSLGYHKLALKIR